MEKHAFAAALAIPLFAGCSEQAQLHKPAHAPQDYFQVEVQKTAEAAQEHKAVQANIIATMQKTCVALNARVVNGNLPDGSTAVGCLHNDRTLESLALECKPLKNLPHPFVMGVTESDPPMWECVPMKLYGQMR